MKIIHKILISILLGCFLAALTTSIITAIEINQINKEVAEKISSTEGTWIIFE